MNQNSVPTVQFNPAVIDPLPQTDLRVVVIDKNPKIIETICARIRTKHGFKDLLRIAQIAEDANEDTDTESPTPTVAEKSVLTKTGAISGLSREQLIMSRNVRAGRPSNLDLRV